MESDAAFHVGIAAASPTELGIVAQVMSIKASGRYPGSMGQWLSVLSRRKAPGVWVVPKSRGRHREKKDWYHQRPPYSLRTSYSRLGAEEMTGARASPVSSPGSQASSLLRSRSQRIFFRMFVDVYMFVDARVCGSLWRLGQTQVSFLKLCVQRPEASLWEPALSTHLSSGDGTQVVRLGSKHLCPLNHLASPEGGFQMGRSEQTLVQTGVLMKMWIFVSPHPEPIQEPAQSVGVKRIQEWEGCAGLGGGLCTLGEVLEEPLLFSRMGQLSLPPQHCERASSHAHASL